MTIDNEGIVIKPLGSTKLFQPIKLGFNTLSQRIAFAPSTRYRATKDNIPTDLQLEYYSQRSEYPGTLIITEATYTSRQGGLVPYVPGIYNDAQTKSWKKINDAIHANGSFSSVQLWYLGRVANPKDLKDAGLPFVGASSVYWNEESEKLAKEVGNELRELTEEEIDHIVEVEYPNAAKRALEAGFDYVEVHCAHGYLLDQFLNLASNKRTDKYGCGSIENRARLLLRIIDKLIDIVGAERLAVRLSPWATFQNVDVEGEEIHSYIIDQFQERANSGNELAYISLVEPRVQASWDIAKENQVGSNEFILKHWKGKVIRAGTYAHELNKINEDINNDRTLIAFSRFFISNPDLVKKLHDGISLTPYERATFYNHDNFGYNTWIKYGENKVFNEQEEKKKLGKPLA
ncbi:NADPH2 dehydrogenase [Candida albicans P57055]|nr:NADPH2 dehydrogenase [Candida albicans P57055]